MDPSLGSFMNNLRRQTVNRKIRSFEAIGKGNPIVPIDVIPASAPVAPSVSQNRGRPTKTTQVG